MKEKKKSDPAVLLEYAGSYKGLTLPAVIQGHEVKELPLEKSTLIETIVLLQKQNSSL